MSSRDISISACDACRQAWQADLFIPRRNFLRRIALLVCSSQLFTLTTVDSFRLSYLAPHPHRQHICKVSHQSSITPPTSGVSSCRNVHLLLKHPNRYWHRQPSWAFDHCSRRVSQPCRRVVGGICGLLTNPLSKKKKETSSWLSELFATEDRACAR